MLHLVSQAVGSGSSIVVRALNMGQRVGGLKREVAKMNVVGIKYSKPVVCICHTHTHMAGLPSWR